MKAIRVARFGGPEVLELQDAPDPAPAAGQALVRVRAAGVNPVETYIRSGAYTRVPPLPYTPGGDLAGVVEAVGPGVRGLERGQRVYAAGSLTGAYAQLAVCPASRVFPLPDALTFQQGAALGVPYGTAYRALFERGRALKGELALIHGGTGGVGTACLQLCRWRGVRAAATGGTAEGRELAVAQGAESAFDHRASGYETRLLEWTGGRGFDLIVEMLANANLDRDLQLLAARGRVVVVGSRGRVEVDPRALMTRDADVLGMSLMNAGDDDLRRIHEALGEGLRAGALSPVVSAELPLARAPEAHELVMKPGARGKIVLLP